MQRIETDVLILRPLELNDQADFYRYMGNESLCKMYGVSPNPFSEYKKNLFQEYYNSKSCYAIVHRMRGDMVGHILIEPSQAPASMVPPQERERGYSLRFALAVEYQHHGLMRNALYALTSKLMEDAQITHIHCSVKIGNRPCVRLMRWLHFETQGDIARRMSDAQMDYILKKPGPLHITNLQALKCCTFPTSGMYGATATMLTLLGNPTCDVDLVKAIELPYIFRCDDDQISCGTQLSDPGWLQLALGPLGFHMVTEELPKKYVWDRLPQLDTAILPVRVDKVRTHPVIFSGHSKTRRHFINLHLPRSTEPQELDLTQAALRDRMPEQVTLHYLERCDSTNRQNMVPYLEESLEVLSLYYMLLSEIWISRLDKERALARGIPLLKPLYSSYLPMLEILTEDRLASRLYHNRISLFNLYYGSISIIAPSKYIPLKDLHDTFDQISKLIQRQIDKLSNW